MRTWMRGSENRQNCERDLRMVPKVLYTRYRGLANFSMSYQTVLLDYVAPIFQSSGPVLHAATLGTVLN